MTREEAKIWLNKLYIRTDITDEYGDMEDMQPYEEALDMAIKALEQEPILDKIRAEIAEHADRLKDSLYGDGMRHCIDIIDKYKVESECTE